MNPIKVLKSIFKKMDNNKEQYVVEPQKYFTRNCKVSFYDMMWFLLLIGANSMSEEIQRAFNDKDFSYISKAAILKSRSKIKVTPDLQTILAEDMVVIRGNFVEKNIFAICTLQQIEREKRLTTPEELQALKEIPRIIKVVVISVPLQGRGIIQKMLWISFYSFQNMTYWRF